MIPEGYDESKFRYNPVSPEYMYNTVSDFEKNLEKYKKVMFSWLEGYSNNLRINIPMLYRIVERIDQRKDYYLYFHSNHKNAMRMSQAKEVALFCYWFLKYKPLSFEEAYNDAKFFEENSYTLNELYVAYILITFIVGLDEENQRFFNAKVVSTLTYSMTNREISKETIILYVESFLTNDLEFEKEA